MRRFLVTSSRIVSMGWSNGVMELEFPDGAIYQYYNVTMDDYWEFLRAPSLGRALSAFDKVHPYIRVNLKQRKGRS